MADFNQLRIRENNKTLIAFQARFGLFEYNIMLFRLCNWLASFQLYINDTLREYLDIFCSTYLDNILIYGKYKLEHEVHLKNILTCL